VSQFSCFPAPAPSVISPLSLHDALPIYRLGLNLEYAAGRFQAHDDVLQRRTTVLRLFNFKSSACSSESGKAFGPSERAAAGLSRSEEHTSELQSRFDLVCRLLLEKKNKK